MKGRFWHALVASCLASCAPMTFSHDAELDFETYSSVRVTVDAPLPGASEYLAAELREASGFERVTSDPGEPASLLLDVTVTVEERTTTNSAGETEIEYDGDAAFRATTPTGEVVLEGTESDTSETHFEASEDVLDEVALHFLAPYRI